MSFTPVLISVPLVGGARASLEARRNRAAQHFLRRTWGWLLLAAMLCILPAWHPASGQEIIHARAGQLISANAKAKTLTLKVADGSLVTFRDVGDPEPALSFDKEVRKKTVAPGDFHTEGAYVVVFYFGYGDLTAVAVEGLGPTAPLATTGSVANFDRHKHVLTLKTDTAAARELAISDDTIVDTPEGVVRSADFHPSKGEQFRCFAKPESQAALLVALN